VLGICKTQNIARLFDGYVLEPSACANQRSAGLAGKSNGVNRALKALVRTSGANEEAIEWLQQVRTVRRYPLSRQPLS
jgi:hypothetical protein